MDRDYIIEAVKKLIKAHDELLLGNERIPEDANPGFTEGQLEESLVYFTLPMALNYQRNSYKLWEGVLAAYNDPETNDVFSITNSANENSETLREKLLKHKVALQPNKHIATRSKIAKTINENRGSVQGLLEESDYDFLKLKEIVQKKHKKGFPYLSGPKIFNYRSCVLQDVCGITLSNPEYIEIAPDTHVIQASIRLGALTEEEAETMTREKMSERRREILKGSGISPRQVHSPFWYRSRGNFQFTV